MTERKIPGSLGAAEYPNPSVVDAIEIMADAKLSNAEFALYCLEGHEQSGNRVDMVV